MVRWGGVSVGSGFLRYTERARGPDEALDAKPRSLS